MNGRKKNRRKKSQSVREKGKRKWLVEGRKRIV